MLVFIVIKEDEMGNGAKFQIEFSAQQVKNLDRLQELGGLSKRRDLINNALSLLEWVVREVNEGRMIASVDEKQHKYKEFTMPMLDEVRNKASEILVTGNHK